MTFFSKIGIKWIRNTLQIQDGTQQKFLEIWQICEIGCAQMTPPMNNSCDFMLVTHISLTSSGFLPFLGARPYIPAGVASSKPKKI